MKNLMNLKGAKALNKKEQQAINGGGHFTFTPNGPCGETGGTISNDSQGSCFGYGYFWFNDQCWICY